MKVLSIIKARIDSYGIAIGLINSAHFIVDYIEDHCEDVEAKLVVVVDGNAIDKEIAHFKPNLVIIEAIFVHPKKLIELVCLHPKVDFVIRVHSRASFLSQEGSALEYLKEYQKIPNVRISFNHPDTTREFEQILNDDFLYLPNIYYPKWPLIKNQDIKKAHNSIDVGCLGAIRPLKNVFEQSCAAVVFANKINKKLYFHINANRVEQNADNNLKNIRALFDHNSFGHKLVEHPWVSHGRFLIELQQLDIAMALSFSESHNLTVCNYFQLGIPTVVSNEIYWTPGLLKSNPTDTNAIVDKLCMAYRHPKIADYLQKRSLNKYNDKAAQVWRNFLNKEMGEYGCR